MKSTFMGIELGKRGIMASSQALDTAGHNISNANTEGYSRQRVKLGSTDPLYMPQLNRAEVPGQIGQGVDVVSVERVRDDLLQSRIVSSGDRKGYWNTRSDYLLQVEQIYNEPNDTSVRTLMDKFWEGWQELSVNPSDQAARRQVARRGETLISGINNRYNSLKEVRSMLDDDVAVSVGEVNDILSNIRQLNEQIVKVEALGDNPNDLYDKRDLLVEDLSDYMKISVENKRDPDEFQIHTGGRELIQGKKVNYLATEPNGNNEGYLDITWQGSEERVELFGGKLAALTELRDGDLREEIQNLDMMTINFTDMVNGIHRQAWNGNHETGIDFFNEYPFINNVAGNYDRNGDGEADTSWVYRFTGSHTLNPQQQAGLEGAITLNGASGDVEIAYHASDTVGDIMERINNSASEVKAMLDFNGRMVLKASPASQMGNPDFVIRHVEDSGQFLAGYAGILENTGADGAYDWNRADAVLALRGGETDFAVAPLAHPSGWLQMNETLLTDPNAIAVGLGENGRPAAAGDGSAALAIADLRQNQVMVGPQRSFDDYFSETVAKIGLKGEQAELTSETENLAWKELKDMQQSISGVNLDEEFADLIKFQHGFNAVSRYITTVDDMLDTIINRMGV
ncbi:MAG: flagellar hook-associated protein FlgK [Spirochaetales bacterium]|nr:flagellar hook-associated protein FlgK [Spirochaetales bacterium]